MQCPRKRGGMGGMPPVNFSQRVAATCQFWAIHAVHLSILTYFKKFQPSLSDFPPVS